MLQLGEDGACTNTGAGCSHPAGNSELRVTWGPISPLSRYIFSTKSPETDRNRPLKGIYWELWTNKGV